MQWHKMATRWKKSPTVLFVKLEEEGVAFAGKCTVHVPACFILHTL